MTHPIDKFDTVPNFTTDDIDNAMSVSVTQYFNGTASISFVVNGKRISIYKMDNELLFHHVLEYIRDTRDPDIMAMTQHY